MILRLSSQKAAPRRLVNFPHVLPHTSQRSLSRAHLLMLREVRSRAIINVTFRALARRFESHPHLRNHLIIIWKKELAEGVGFEPTRPLRAYTRSRRAPSTTRPSLRKSLERAHYTHRRPERNLGATHKLQLGHSGCSLDFAATGAPSRGISIMLSGLPKCLTADANAPHWCHIRR